MNRYVVTDTAGKIWFGEMTLNWFQKLFPPKYLTLRNARQSVNKTHALNTVFFKVNDNLPFALGTHPTLIPGFWTNVAIAEITLQWSSFFRVHNEAEKTGLSDRPSEDRKKYGLEE